MISTMQLVQHYFCFQQHVVVPLINGANEHQLENRLNEKPDQRMYICETTFSG